MPLLTLPVYATIILPCRLKAGEARTSPNCNWRNGIMIVKRSTRIFFIGGLLGPADHVGPRPGVRVRVSVKIKEIYSRNLNRVTGNKSVCSELCVLEQTEEAPILPSPFPPPRLESGNIVSLMALKKKKKMLKRRY